MYEVLYLISTLSFEKVLLNLECGMNFFKHAATVHRMLKVSILVFKLS